MNSSCSQAFLVVNYLHDKVLDGRSLNGKFWVLYGALTDVGYNIAVTDTVTGAMKSYYNPPINLAGRADVNAF